VWCVLYCLCSFVCCVLFECGVLFCVMCAICVLRCIVVPLPPGKNPFAVYINNNNIFRLQSLCHIAIRVEAYRAQNGLKQCHNCHSSATSGQTASNLPVACGAGAIICTRSAPSKGIHLPPQRAATVDWLKEKTPTPPIIGAADTPRRRCRKRSLRR
jgi:hypothetical protein